MMVDVHFLTGTETTGFNLHINGEGAGKGGDVEHLVLEVRGMPSSSSS